MSFQIIHLRDFEYWRIFYGLTREQMEEREESCEYPPRLQIECEQVNPAKSLKYILKVSKKSKDTSKVIIAQFTVKKEVTGTHIHTYINTYIHTYIIYSNITTHIA